MLPIKLHYPINNLDGKLLLPAGSELSDDSVRGLLASSGPVSLKTFHLMGHGSVKHDLFSILETPPYDTIFSDPDCLSEIIDVMKSIRFVSPVLEVLDFF